MHPQSPGSFRLFTVFGIDVLLHWSWFVVAAIQMRFSHWFGNPFWHAVTYLSLFGIVLLHEFGHALACRSVGGQANHIVLWPLGGIAFVRPPARPGAVLWSIAAGPLVNVLLVPVTFLIYMFVAGGVPSFSLAVDMPDLQRFAYIMCAINLGILCFNMLPVYPLDGGQILQALLWFRLGRARSLKIATMIGMAVAMAAGALAFSGGNMWMLVMAVFIG